MLNFALCDDNESILARLSKMLESLFIKYNFDCKVSFTSVDPNSFLAYVINNPVDVIFLDIDLKSNINGLSLAETIRKYNKNNTSNMLLGRNSIFNNTTNNIKEHINI